MRLRSRPVQRSSFDRRPAIPKIGFMGLRQVLQSVKGSGPLALASLLPSLPSAIQSCLALLLLSQLTSTLISRGVLLLCGGTFRRFLVGTWEKTVLTHYVYVAAL